MNKPQDKLANPDRRKLLKSLSAASAVAMIQSRAGRWMAFAQTAPASRTSSTTPAKNPAWYGFNLLEYFSTDPDWMKYFPYKDDGMFPEDDFRWIRDWGFNWVRLPMDYRFWTAPDLFTINEKKVEPIDRAVRLGEKYGVHVNVCLHRAPGECILDTMNESLTGIHISKEKTSVYDDSKTLDAFVHQWSFFAKRYKGISNDRVSFNLVNEPFEIPTPAEQKQLDQMKPEDRPNSEIGRRGARDYSRVARAAVEAIRKQDPERLIVTDGYPVAGSPIPDLFETGILQSCHTYNPVQLTHYHCEWARGFVSGSAPLPTWPLKDSSGKVICDRDTLVKTFQPWGELAQKGIRIHFGEMGCYKHTPPDVVLAWFNDTLDVLRCLNSGWALWNFRGPFGVLDTERPGTKYEDWQGHKLDRPLLNLLQGKMKS
ncbi:MAG TPA: cellulase family glycosylhydrolase [Terriglobales bacterium]|nr:cellulase family glycosylhydrolase [Terriglobales bacterium]